MSSMICPRCKATVPRLRAVSGGGRQAGALCDGCLQDLAVFLTSMPSDGRQDWASFGALDGDKLIERFE